MCHFFLLLQQLSIGGRFHVQKKTRLCNCIERMNGCVPVNSFTLIEPETITNDGPNCHCVSRQCNGNLKTNGTILVTFILILHIAMRGTHFTHKNGSVVYKLCSKYVLNIGPT